MSLPIIYQSVEISSTNFVQALHWFRKKVSKQFTCLLPRIKTDSIVLPDSWHEEMLSMLCPSSYIHIGKHCSYLR